VKLCFEYRSYAGFAENLYSNTWLRTEWIGADKEGNFSLLLPELEKGKEYQYRAVVAHPQLTVRGDIKRFVVK
jgi:alpha-L-fucosidase